jgi:hypothetical protein
MVLYKCTTCDKIFNKIYNFKRHVNRKKPCKNEQKRALLNQCPKCYKSYPSSVILEEHLSQSCVQTRYEQSQSHKSHQKPPKEENSPPKPTKSHQKKYIKLVNKNKCPRCCKTYSSSGNLKRHLSQHCKMPKIGQIEKDKKKRKNELLKKRKNERSNKNMNENPITLEFNQDKKRKNELLKMSKNELLNDVDIICKYCDKQFCRNDSLKRHIKSRCKIKNKIMDEREQIFNKLIEIEQKVNYLSNENKNLSNENKNLKQLVTNNNKPTISNTTNIINNSIGKIENNTIIQLVAFGSEDMSKISDEHYRYFIGQ